MRNTQKKYSDFIEVKCPYCSLEKILFDRTADIKVYCRCNIFKKYYVIDGGTFKVYKSGPIPYA